MEKIFIAVFLYFFLYFFDGFLNKTQHTTNMWSTCPNHKRKFSLVASFLSVSTWSYGCIATHVFLRFPNTSAPSATDIFGLFFYNPERWEIITLSFFSLPRYIRIYVDQCWNNNIESRDVVIRFPRHTQPQNIWCAIYMYNIL